MKNGFFLFLGIFAVVFLTWFVLIGLNVTHYGGLQPHDDDVVPGEFAPWPTVGLAGRGEEVYASMGCVACHTQRVRRPGFGADAQRGWGDRQSVARDYIGQRNVMLGGIRMGPDLRNIGERPVPEEWDDLTWEQYQHLHLFDPRMVVEGSLMPSFSFLYEKRKIVGEQSRKALPLKVEDGYEIVPNDKAIALVAYLRSLRLDYALPETEHLTVEAMEARDEQE